MYEDVINKYVRYDTAKGVYFASNPDEKDDTKKESSFYYSNALFLDVAKKVRTNIVMGTDLDRNKEILCTLIQRYNWYSEKLSGYTHTAKPTPKTPGAPASSLYGKEEIEKFDVRYPNDVLIYSNNIAKEKEPISTVMEFEWIEDYFETFTGEPYIASKLAVEAGEAETFEKVKKAVRDALHGCRAARGLKDVTDGKGHSLYGLMHDQGMQVLCQGCHTLHGQRARNLLMLSYIEGGNMLPAEDFILIGKDSLDLTCILNRTGQEEAAKLMASELHYDTKDLFFVEQPDYHLDLMVMHLGGGSVMVKASNKGISMEKTIHDLCSCGKIKKVYVSCRDKTEIPDLKCEKIVAIENDIGGRQNPASGDWEYNFFNGEYLSGKDQKLYYLTNDTAVETAKVCFREFMKKVAGVHDVIFDPRYTMKELNQDQGGFGCAHKAIR